MYHKKPDLGELILFRTLNNMPEYLRLGKELATLIKELRFHSIELHKGEHWQIKGTTYQVIEDIDQVNYQLTSTSDNPTIIWLSELLPLGHQDFLLVSYKHCTD